MACFLCEAEENLRQCSKCGRAVCEDDSIIPEPAQLHLFIGPKALMCLSCRVVEFPQNGNDPFVEKIPTDPTTGQKRTGLIYSPTVLAQRKVLLFGEKLQTLSVTDIKSILSTRQAAERLAKHIYLFSKVLLDTADDVFTNRIRELKRKRSNIYEIQQKPKTKRLTPDVLAQMALRMAASGITVEQLTGRLKQK